MMLNVGGHTGSEAGGPVACGGQEDAVQRACVVEGTGETTLGAFLLPKFGPQQRRCGP